MSAGGRVEHIPDCYEGKTVFRPDLLIKEQGISNTVAAAQLIVFKSVKCRFANFITVWTCFEYEFVCFSSYYVFRFVV
jgi:hypothetical protein